MGSLFNVRIYYKKEKFACLGSKKVYMVNFTNPNYKLKSTKLNV